MLRFLLRRLLVAIPTLFLVVTASFFMMRAAPGGPFDSQRRLPPEVERNIKAKYGLDKPLAVQYVNYLGGVLRGDLGPSLKYRDRTVVGIIAENFPTSLRLGLASLLIGVSIGVLLGSIAAMRQNTGLDYGVTTFAILGLCIPTFVTAPLLVLVFAQTLDWFPTGGISEPKSFVLPVITLALPQVAVISRLTRAGMIEVLHSNYIRTARAKGLPERRIVCGPRPARGGAAAGELSRARDRRRSSPARWWWRRFSACRAWASSSSSAPCSATTPWSWAW